MEHAKPLSEKFLRWNVYHLKKLKEDLSFAQNTTKNTYSIRKSDINNEKTLFLSLKRTTKGITAFTTTFDVLPVIFYKILQNFHARLDLIFI